VTAAATAIVLHGARGGPDTHWFAWLHAELGARGVAVIRPRLPTPDGQSLATWLAAFDAAATDARPDRTVLVGHSLGAAFAIRVVERSPVAFAGLCLAAPFWGALGLSDYDGINASFFARPLDGAGVRTRAGPVRRCWAGDDDPYVPLHRSREVAATIGGDLDVVADGGHLGSEAGFVAFPAIRDAVMAAFGE
jgi:hypothetical protein